MGLFSKSAHYCRTPKFSKGKVTWTCHVCGARFRYHVPKRTDRQGRPITRGSWLMIQSGHDNHNKGR